MPRIRLQRLTLSLNTRLNLRLASHRRLSNAELLVPRMVPIRVTCPIHFLVDPQPDFFTRLNLKRCNFLRLPKLDRMLVSLLPLGLIDLGLVVRPLGKLRRELFVNS